MNDQVTTLRKRIVALCDTIERQARILRTEADSLGMPRGYRRDWDDERLRRESHYDGEITVARRIREAVQQGESS